MRHKAGLIIISFIFLNGCVTQKQMRFETPTQGAGNANAHNSLLQISDPWSEGVKETDLTVPYSHAFKSTQAAAQPATQPAK
jgi:hypothetical protein